MRSRASRRNGGLRMSTKPTEELWVLKTPDMMIVTPRTPRAALWLTQWAGGDFVAEPMRDYSCGYVYGHMLVEAWSLRYGYPHVAVYPR